MYYQIMIAIYIPWVKNISCSDKWHLTFCLTSEWIVKFTVINKRLILPFNRLPDASKSNERFTHWPGTFLDSK